MKFSVWDYSQIKIAQFNTSHPALAIDPTDIFIFTWFKGFATKTKSKSSENTHSKGMWTKTIDGVDYFNIRYEAIIKDFPILSFTSVKSIQRRFDKYIEAGIFVKKIIYSGKKGNFTYFAFTDLFWSFEYDNNNPEHKQVGADNSVQTKTVGVDNSVRTKPLGEDNSVQTKPLGLDNSVQTLINNPTTSLNNPTTTSSTSREINFIPKENTDSFMQAEAEVFNDTIIKLFGYNPRFSPDPFPNLIQTMISCDVEINLMPKYVEWIYSELKPKCKNPDSFVNYFYKSFTQPCHIARYSHILQEKQKKAEDKDMALCPICGNSANIYGQCSCCNFEMLDRFDRKKVSIKKQIYELPKNDKEAFNREFEAELKRQKTFGVVAMLTNPTLRAEFQERLKNIYHKYGITA